MWSVDPPAIPSGLFGQLRFDPELTILCLLLAALLVAGGVLVVRTRRWRGTDPAGSIDDQVQNYQALVERGELAPEEFERIKARLEAKAKEPPPDESPPETPAAG